MIRGEDIVLGVGVEATPNTPVAPQIYIPGRSPATLGPRVNKAQVRETRATKMSSHGSEVVTKSAGGALEFNVRNKSIAYLLKSLLGSASVATLETGVYRHTLSLLMNNPLHPTLTMALAQGGNAQDYETPGAIISSLSLNIGLEDIINASIEYAGIAVNEHAAYSPSFGSDDYYFRPQDVSVRLATTLAGLDAADPVSIRDLSLELTNNGEGRQYVGSQSYSKMKVGDFEATGSFSMDYEDDTYHDIFMDGGYRAMRIILERSDITLGTTNHPRIEINLPKISFESYDPDRPIDDIVTEGIGFMAHYSLSDSLGIQVKIDNGLANLSAA